MTATGDDERGGGDGDNDEGDDTNDNCATMAMR